ncbi:MAG: FHA domain-containing protein [Planctomycetota bacterium]
MKPPSVELRVLSGELAGRSFPLAGERLTVGRGPDCDVVLAIPSVSRLHAEILPAPAGALVRDLGSHNGIRVEGQRVPEAEIPPGGVFSIGGIRLQIATHGDRLPATIDSPPSAPLAPAPEALPGQVLSPDEIFAHVSGAPVPKAKAAERADARGEVAPPASRRLAPIFSVLALGLAAYVVLRSAPGPEPYAQETIVAVGQEMIIWWKGDRDYKTRRVETGKRGAAEDFVPVESSAIATVTREGIPAILRVVGRQRGDTRAVFFDSFGRVTGRLRIHVTGEAPPAFDRSEFAGWEPPRRETEARALFSGACSLLEGNQPYRAWKMFGKAAFMTQDLNPRPSVHAESKAKAGEAEKEVARRLAPLETKAFDAAREQDWTKLIKACDDLRLVIPDPADIRHQRYYLLSLYARSRRQEASEKTP